MNDNNNENYFRVLSHELKSPINAMHSLLDNLLEGYAGDLSEEVRYVLERARNRSIEAQTVITDLAEFARYGEEAEHHKEKIELTGILYNLIERFTETSSDAGVVLRSAIPEMEVYLDGDERALDHAFRNLIENAIKYSESGGEVSLNAEIDDEADQIIISISDSGMGIPEKDLETIFDPFFRSRSIAFRRSGTGLGLSIVKRVIEIHNGHVTVKSEEGKGSTFTVTLPYTEVEKTTPRDPKRKVVIIGGITSGPKTAARLRRLDEDVEITIIEKERFLSYAGCGLPWYVSGRVDSPQDLMSSADSTIRDIRFFEKIADVRVLSGTTAERIDRRERCVVVREEGSERTQSIPYDDLVIATGAVADLPSIPGIQSPAVFTLRSMEDAERLREALSGGAARDVVVLGAGLVGLAAADEILSTGARITLIEHRDRILASSVDRDIAERIEADIGRAGIKILTDVEAQSIQTDTHGIVLESSEGSIHGDILLVSAGTKPNSRLAEEAGLVIGESGGIKIDEHMQTNDEHIYAVGDCAEIPHLLNHDMKPRTLGSASTKTGRLVADILSGRGGSFEGTLATSIFALRDVRIGRTGLTGEQARDMNIDIETAVVTGSDRAHFDQDASEITVKLIVERGSRRLLGAQIFGRSGVEGRIGELAVAISAGVDIERFSDIDLGYSPSFNNAIDIAQVACNVLANKLDGLVKTVVPEELEKSDILISVCPTSGLETCRIPGSMHIPLERLRTERIDSSGDRRIVLYSKTSSGAYIGYRFLVSTGMRNIYVLEGGYLHWRR